MLGKFMCWFWRHKQRVVVFKDSNYTTLTCERCGKWWWVDHILYSVEETTNVG